MTRATSLATSADGKLLLGTLHGLFEAETGFSNRIEAVPAMPFAHQNSPKWSRLAQYPQQRIGFLENGKFDPVAPEPGAFGISAMTLPLMHPGIVHITTNRGSPPGATRRCGDYFQKSQFWKKLRPCLRRGQECRHNNGKVYVATAKGTLSSMRRPPATNQQCACMPEAFTASGKELSFEWGNAATKADDDQFVVIYRNQLSQRQQCPVPLCFEQGQ